MSKAMKIAIVDDEKDMRQSISQWLALSGFDTETYASAEDARHGRDAIPQKDQRRGQRLARYHDHRPRRCAHGGRGNAHGGIRFP